MYKRALLILAVLTGALLFPSNVAAHELIKDQSGGLGALFYISPDDDPVAGERATLFYEFTNTTIVAEASRPKLTITDGRGETAETAVTASGSSLSADYVFPRQGLYNIRLEVTEDGDAHIFTQSIRVSRGEADNEAVSDAPAWAVTGAATTMTAAALMAGIAFKRRKTISEYSRMVK